MDYAMPGAAWLCTRTELDLRDLGYRTLPWLLGGAVFFVVVASVSAAGMNLQVRPRWVKRPVIAVTRALGSLGAAGLAAGLLRRIDATLFPPAALVFLSGFAILAASSFPTWRLSASPSWKRRFPDPASPFYSGAPM